MHHGDTEAKPGDVTERIVGTAIALTDPRTEPTGESYEFSVLSVSLWFQ